MEVVNAIWTVCVISCIIIWEIDSVTLLDLPWHH